MDYGRGVYHMLSRWKSLKIKEFSGPRMKFFVTNWSHLNREKKRMNKGDFPEVKSTWIHNPSVWNCAGSVFMTPVNGNQLD